MTSHLQESLENLRLRATCAICTELYTKPKQLPNCSHVFCLTCVKRYMQAKLPNNFPPCPMCRAPITHEIRDVDLLEPARAEEDIIEFVRPYENCDLCKKRERPLLRCLECSGLVCENCQVVHGKLQSHHTVVSIFESGVVVQRPVIKNECKTHPNQTLDLYCLMCNTMLCLYCDKYKHTSCTQEFEEFVAYRRKLNNSSQLMQDFVYSSEERKNLISGLETKMHRIRAQQTARLDRSFAMLHAPTSNIFRTMSPPDQAMSRLQNLTSPTNYENTPILTPPTLMVVQVNEFSAFARNFIREITEEVENEVDFYEEYVGRLENVAGSTEDSKELNDRKNNLETEIGKVIEMGKMISESNRLMEKSTDIEVAEFALRKEKASLQFFRFRKTYSLDACCIELGLERVNDTKSVIRQRAVCTMTKQDKSDAKCLFVDTVEIPIDLLSVNGEAETSEVKGYTSTNSTEKQITTAENKLVFNTIKCLNVEKGDEYSNSYMNSENAMITNAVYENMFSKNAQRLQVLVKGGLAIDVRTINKIGFTGNHYSNAIESKCLDRCKYSKKRSYVNIKPHGLYYFKYQTYMTNVFLAAPFTYESESKTIVRKVDIDKDQSVPIICLIGSRGGLDSGIETLCLAVDEYGSYEFSNGVSIKTKVARFKQTDFSCARGTTVSDISVYKGEEGQYCLLKGQAYSGRSLVAYSTKVTEGPDNAAVYYISKDGPVIAITVNGFRAELLCEMKGGMFYVTRDEETGALVVGKLIMDGVLKKKTILTVTGPDSAVETDKIRPLTMSESRREELVIACAVEGDASKLAMIVPMKESVEILEIQYPDSEYNAGDIFDLEMDCDGNIMCLLKDIEGNIWSVITKYIMP